MFTEKRTLTGEERKALEFFENAIKMMTPEQVKKVVEMTEAIAEFKKLTGKLPA